MLTAEPDPRWIAGQLVSLVALGLCVAGFASRRDDRLFMLLIAANVAFALQFALFRSWVAAAVTVLVVFRVVLVRRYYRRRAVMLGVLAASGAAAWLTWHGWQDLPALAAGFAGTYGMFMLRGIPMRLWLALAAFCWILSNALAGSIGGVTAETLILVTNLFTVYRLWPDRR